MLQTNPHHSIKGPRRNPLCLWPLVLFLAVFSGVVLYRMDQNLRQQFEDKRWRLPSAVFARPLDLSLGTSLRADDLERELLELAYARVSPAPKRPGEYSLENGIYSIYRRPFMFWDAEEKAAKINVEILNGKIVRAETKEKGTNVLRLDPLKIGGIYPSEKEDRKLVRLNQLPPQLIKALLAIEDKDFYSHWGISPRAIFRALVANYKAGAIVQGGSTITQQLVKNSFLTSERSLRRKALEAVYSLLLELHYSKDEILESYVNEIYLGQSGDNAIHGFGLASEFYFGRSIESLSISQSALLAAIVNGPSFYNPMRYPERCQERRDHVLKLLLKRKAISRDAYTAAVQRDVAVATTPSISSMANRFPAYLDLVRRNLQHTYEREYLAKAGLRVFTALDPIIQLQSEAAVADFMKSQGKKSEKLQVAAVVVSEKGEVESLIGDKVASYQGFNRALDARRSIGSLAKPAVLLAALNDPHQYSLNSLVADSPITVPLSDGQTWRPLNYDKSNHGPVTLLNMLSQSYNQAAVRLGMQVGVKRVRETFARLTGDSSFPEVPSIILGSAGMSPFQVAGMYYPIFTGGNRTALKAVRGVQTQDGKPLKVYLNTIDRIFDSGSVQLVQYAMRTAITEGTGRAALAYLPRDVYAAGKTGTTNDQRDSWFAGFTRDKLAVAWVGNDLNEPTNLTGSSGGLTVWAKIMGKVSRKPRSPDNIAALGR